MNMKNVILGTTLFISACALNAQSVQIPVIFHVLYENAQQNLPDSVLQHQLDVLNEDYQAANPDLVNVPAVWQPLIGNMDIGFEFASVDPQGNPTIGIERRAVTNASPPAFNPHSFALGGLDPWSDSVYLNIWVWDIPSGVLAYSEFPSATPSPDRGLDILWSVVGRNETIMLNGYDKGRTATHELGHYFGLYHIWGDDGSSCSGSDYIADTPNQADENFTAYAPGTVITDACSPAPGIMWQNYMDYTEDAGMCFFTQGQVVRVTQMINTYMPYFLVPNGIDPIDREEAVKYSVFPSPSTNGIFQVNRVDYNTKTSVEVYDLQGRMVLAPEYFETGSTTMQVDLSGFTNGTYSFVIRTEREVETKRVVIAK